MVYVELGTEVGIALLAHHRGDGQAARDIHREVARGVVARLRRGGWSIGAGEIEGAIAAALARRTA